MVISASVNQLSDPQEEFMATTKKDPVLVILQLTGANDYLNTIIPYTEPEYWDNRPKVHIPEDQMLHTHRLN